MRVFRLYMRAHKSTRLNFQCRAAAQVPDIVQKHKRIWRSMATEGAKDAVDSPVGSVIELSATFPATLDATRVQADGATEPRDERPLWDLARSSQ